MSVTLTGTGGLATRLAAFASEYNRVVSAYGSALNTGVAAIDAQFLSNEQLAVDTLYTTREAYRGVHGSYTASLVSFATQALIQQVDRDTPLASRTTSAALTELRRQMVADGTTIQRPTVTLTVAADANNKGNAQVVASATNPLGDQNDMVFAEDVTLTVSSDSASGGTKWAEGFSVVGEPTKGSADYLWPGGSGASGTFSISNPETTNILTDGGFESWGGTGNNTPTSWAISVGAAGTQVTRSTSTVRGNYAARLTSNGSTLTTIRQDVTSRLVPNAVYAISYWAKMSAADASGAFRVRLCDGTGTTLVNDASTALAYSRNTNGQIGTSYTFIYTFFQTPRQLSDTVWFEMGYTTSPASPKTLDLDLVGFTAASLLYPGGPYVAAFSKDAANARGDYYTLTVTNTADVHTFAKVLDRFFSIRQLGLYLPSTTSSPTISDSLIT